MKKLNPPYRTNWVRLIFLSIIVAGLSPVAFAARDGWRRREVNWRLAGDRSIKAVNYPADRPPVTLDEHRRHQPTVGLREITQSTTASALVESADGAVFAAVIDSPPLDGFVPWIIVSVTDEIVGWDFNAYFSDEVIGECLTDNPQSDYAIGIFDTGASSHVINDYDSFKTGIAPDLVTSIEVELIGATGTAIAHTSEPLGVFIGGLDSLEPNGFLVDDSEMLGEYNVSVLVGDPIESPNLPTVIGISLGVYLNTAFCNNKQLSVTIDGNDFNSPYIEFYSLSDSCTPSYSNLIDLQLRPTDASAVQYFPCELLGLCGGEQDGTPVYPSMIWGMRSSQSLYFLPWVNLADGNDSISGLDGFMFDTGAQITVISRTMASGMHLNTNEPEFEVEIMDVTGQITFEPGFYLDYLQMPADGQWLEYTNVPVVVMNIDSPEGGYLDGIIGMNLFVDLNFVVKGGGMAGQGYSPTLQFEHVSRITGDIAGDCYQCRVDYEDLAAFSEAWLASYSPRTDNWNLNADLAPQPTGDQKINFLDFAVLAQHWLETSP